MARFITKENDTVLKQAELLTDNFFMGIEVLI